MYDIGKEYLWTCIPHTMSHTGKEKVWRFMGKYGGRIAQLLAEEGGKLPHYRTLRRHAMMGMPPINMIQITRRDGIDSRTPYTVDALEGEDVVYTEANITVSYPCIN
jgi:hypothetical protein